MKWVNATSRQHSDIVWEAIGILRENTDRKVNIRGLKQEEVASIEAKLRTSLTQQEAEHINSVKSYKTDDGWVMEIQIGWGHCGV